VSSLKAVLINLTVIDWKGKISYLEFRNSEKGECYKKKVFWIECIIVVILKTQGRIVVTARNMATL
jgi:hypothetical protein